MLENNFENKYQVCLLQQPKTILPQKSFHHIQLFAGAFQNRCSEKSRNIHIQSPTAVLESLLNTVATLRPATLLKRNSNTGAFFCEYCEIFNNRFFYTTPPMVASILRFSACDSTSFQRKYEH